MSNTDNDANFDEEIAQLDELSKIIENLEEEPPPEPESDKKPDEPTRYKSVALEQCPIMFKPSDNVACKSCILAKWYGNDLSLKCYCRDMYQIVYDSEHTENAVHYCDKFPQSNS